MNTIIDKATNLSLFLFKEDREITLEQGMLKIGASDAQSAFFIGNPKAERLKVVRGVEAPADGWRPGKFFHTGKAWKANPDYKPRERKPKSEEAAS